MHPPSALLLLHTTCPHCPAILASLSELVKLGALGRLEVINLSIYPEQAAALNVRSVPWYRIGDFELSGLRSASELRQWVEHAHQGTGMAEYFDTLLQQGSLATVEAILQAQPQYLSAVLTLLGNPDTATQTRLGIGALLEDRADSTALLNLLPELGQLTRHADPRIRTDACHYLGLTATAAALPYLQQCLQDSDAYVRETAADSLALLQE